MLLISDANIFIDLEKIDLINLCTCIPHEIVTTDFVFNELYPHQQSILKRLNIRALEFSGEEVIDFMQQYGSFGQIGISAPDYSLIYKAKQTSSSIMSGDKALRNFATSEKIPILGIFFLLDLFLKQKLLSLQDWKQKLTELQRINPRLPKKEFEKRLL